jgi:hypothetical protein
MAKGKKAEAHRRLIHNFMWITARSYAENIRVENDEHTVGWLQEVINTADNQELKYMGGHMDVIKNLRTIVVKFDMVAQMEAFMTICDDYDLPDLFTAFSGMRGLLIDDDAEKEYEVHPDTTKLIKFVKKAVITPKNFRYSRSSQ